MYTMWNNLSQTAMTKYNKSYIKDYQARVYTKRGVHPGIKLIIWIAAIVTIILLYAYLQGTVGLADTY